MKRRQFVILHRYVGLVLASFLVIASLTGALLVWYHELDQWINSQIMQIDSPSHSSQPLSPFALRDEVQAAFPSASVNWMMLQRTSSTDAAFFYIESGVVVDGNRVELEFDEVFVDPYSGEILGGRKWGDISQGLTNLMPFIYRLHDSLALGTVGTWVFGIVALLWTITCFIGAYLTFPASGRNREERRENNWWQRWRIAWKVRWHGGRYKVNYDLHRAGGLWPWFLLFIFAWSGVALSLNSEIYKPVMSGFMAFQENPLHELTEPAMVKPHPDIGWEPGFKAAKQQLEKLASEQHFQVVAFERFAYYPEEGVMKLMARTSRDINDLFGQTWIYVDAVTGDRIGFYLPTGEASGDTFTTWITTLHIARIWGLPYRILVTVLGILVIMLSVTGVLIWWRKRGARKRSRALQRNKVVSAD